MPHHTRPRRGPTHHNPHPHKARANGAAPNHPPIPQRGIIAPRRGVNHPQHKNSRRELKAANQAPRRERHKPTIIRRKANVGWQEFRKEFQ